MVHEAEVENILAISFFAIVSLSAYHFFFKGGGSERGVEERRGRAGRRQAGRGKWIFHKMSDNEYTNMGWGTEVDRDKGRDKGRGRNRDKDRDRNIT